MPNVAWMMSSWPRFPASSPVTLPSRKTSTRSHSTARSAASMEAMSTPQPARAAARIASMMSCLAPTSTAWVGSRSISSSGWPASHLASTTFCWLPPLSVPAGLGHLLEAGAHQPGEADDLAVPDVHIQAGDLADRKRPDRGGQVSPGVAVDPAVGDKVAAEHQPGQRGLVHVPGVQAGLDDLAVPQHRDPVGHLDDLLEPVRDQQNRGAVGDERPDQLEEPAAGRLTQRPGGLVED